MLYYCCSKDELFSYLVVKARLILNIGSVCLGLKGENGVVRIPSRKGLILDSVGIK